MRWIGPYYRHKWLRNRLWLMSKWGVKCEDELGATEKIRQGKVNVMGIIMWGAKISHDRLYKSSQYQNYIVILVNTLMSVKLQGLPCLYTLINEALSLTMVYTSHHNIIILLWYSLTQPCQWNYMVYHAHTH